MEFKFREADFGAYPKGLMYGLQCLDSWIYDEKEPFMHIEAIETYAFLKEQTKGRYFEELVQKYLLDNTHVSVVITKPQKGLNAENEKALEEKLAAYKAMLSKEEIGVGVKKGEPALLKAVNDELVKLEKTGEAAKIYDVWFGPATKTPQPRAFTIEAK